MEFWVGVAVLAIGVGGWVAYQYSEVRRDQVLEKTAGRLGMDFRFGLPAELRDMLGRFRAIEDARAKGGEFQAGINSITGARRARKLVFFDYQWVTVYYTRRRRSFTAGAEDVPHYRTHRRSAVAAQLGVPLQPVLVRPERLVDKALALVGYDDIDFSALPEFSRRFYVNSPDREAARRLVTPAFARFCLEHVTCTLDFVGPWLLLHDNRPLDPSRVAGRLELASQIADLVTREQSRPP